MTTNRMGLEQVLSDERLELFIRQPLDNGLTRGEQMELVREALARRKESKEPVAWTDAEELRDANSGGCGYLFPIGGSANKFADPRRQIMLYAAPAVTVPDGWQLVPIEPTENMVVEGFESEPDSFFSNSDEWEAYKAMSGCKQAAHKARLCWAAMIAASPSVTNEP